MKKKLSIVKRLWINVSFQISIQIIIGLVAFWVVNQLNGGIRQFAEVGVPAVRNMGLIDMYHDGLRGLSMESIVYAHSGKLDEVAKLETEFEEMSKDMKSRIDELSQLDLSDSEKEKVAAASKGIIEYKVVIANILTQAKSGNIKAAEALLPELLEKFDFLEVELGALGDYITENTVKTSDQYTKLAAKADWINLGVVLIGSCLGLFFAFLLIRSLSSTLAQIVTTLNHESENLNESASKMSQSSESLSSSSQEQSSAIHETVSTLDEISAMVKRGVEHAKNTNEISQKSLEISRNGKQASVDVLNAINDIDKTNNNIVDHMKESNKSISEITDLILEISDKTKVINDIVFQTKLLSFNASVEAARAGEHGKGFAVVAEEVGNLAQMSGTAAEDIRQMLEGSISKVQSIVQKTKSQTEELVEKGNECVKQGVEKAKLCGNTLDEVLSNVENVVGMMNDLANAADEQSTGVSNISSAMNQFTTTTDSNAKIATESTLISKDLSHISIELSQNLVKLQSEIGLKIKEISDSSHDAEYETENLHEVDDFKKVA